MELRQLRYFVAVADTRNFTRAAEQLHIAQPPLSRQIQLLEDELGVRLLLRNSRSVRLTDAGRVFHEQALQVLDRVAQMKAATQRMGMNERRRLSIGFVPSALYGGLPRLIRKLRERFPDIELQMLETTTSMQQVDALQTGRIDIGVGRLRSSSDAVTRMVLTEENLVLAVSAGHVLGESDAPFDLKALAGQSLIVYPQAPRPSFADHVLSLLRDHAIQPREVIEVRELQTALGLVAAEAGVCLVPASARIRNDIVYRELLDMRATSSIILIHRRGDTSWYVSPVTQLAREIYMSGNGEHDGTEQG